MELIQQQEQRQVLSQGLRHSLEILQMPVLELQDAVWDLPAGEGLGEWNRGGDGEWDRMAALADPADRGESLAEALHEQLLRMPGLTDELRRLADYLAECLNENGFLEFSLEDLAADRGVSVFEMEQALYVLQSLQPAGVAARTLPECLVLQLAQTKDFNEYTVRLVRQGLELLAKNNMTAIARLLECTPAQAQAAARAVRALNPRPAQGYGAGPLAYQIPEAVFRRENGQVGRTARWSLSWSGGWPPGCS